MTTSEGAVLPLLDGDRPATAEEIAEYTEKGHCVVRGLATPEEVAAFRPRLRDVAFAHSREKRPLEERSTYDKAFLQIPNLWEKDDDVRRFVLAARFARVAAELLGVEGVRLYHDQALFKEAGGGKTPWHRDQFYWPLEGLVTITMWMPLVEVSFESGSMTFASGTHRRGDLGAIGISDESEEQFGEIVRRERFEKVNYGAMRPGDATFHAGWTLHEAPPNVTDATREVMTVIYMADGIRVSEPQNGNQHADLRNWLTGCAPGDLAAGPRNPLLWPVEPTGAG